MIERQHEGFRIGVPRNRSFNQRKMKPGYRGQGIALAGVVALAVHGTALADSTTLSVQIASEREPDDLGELLNTIYKFGLAHAFDSGVFIDSYFEVEDPAEDGPNKQNLEGNMGYRHVLAGPLSVAGSIGIGERFTEGTDFPYYVLRIGGDLAIDDRWGWNIVTFRYRNAFDTVNDYETPRFTTKLTFRLDERNAIYGEIYRNLNDEWEPTATGVAVGYAFRF
jgi:hypothetical protein